MENEPVDYFLTHESSVRLGAFAHRAGRNDVAISALEDGRSKDLGNARILFNLSGKYYVAGRYEESLTETVRVLGRSTTICISPWVHGSDRPSLVGARAPTDAE